MSEPADYTAALGRELAAAGITGAQRARILDEIADHLACDPAAPLGEPRALAVGFADELGSARAKAAALSSFVALAVAGALFAAAFVAGAGLLRRIQAHAPLGAGLAAGVAVLAAQLAFAAGTLAALRWLRRRGTAVLPAAEARVVVRRAGVGIAAGIVTMVSLGVIALTARRTFGAGWSDAALAAAVLGTLALGRALPAVRAAARLRPAAAGPPGDIFADFGPLVPAPLRGRPWRLALSVAGALLVAITLAGVPAGDEFDGFARGLVEALACLAGFALLGPYLGLWRPTGAGPGVAGSEAAGSER